MNTSRNRVRRGTYKQYYGALGWLTGEEYCRIVDSALDKYISQNAIKMRAAQRVATAEWWWKSKTKVPSEKKQ